MRGRGLLASPASCLHRATAAQRAEVSRAANISRSHVSLLQVKRVIGKYSLREKLPPAVQRWLDEGKMPETPKAHDHAFRKAFFSLIIGMDDLFHPAHHAAEALGFVTCCDNSTDDWPVEKAATSLLGQLEELQTIHRGQRVALIADGEVSSPVTGELTSPSAINATRCPRWIVCNSSSWPSSDVAAFSTGQSSVELSQQVTNPRASAAWCAG